MLPLVVPLAIFVATYGLLWARRKGGPLLPVWAVFAVGGAAMVAAGAESLQQAASSVDWQVLAFLFGMLVISTGLELSGELEALSGRIVGHGRSPFRLMLLLSFGFGLASAVLMNDSLAIMGTPILIRYARKVKVSPKPFLYGLAFAVTIGSVMTPMGNPQNMVVALQSGMAEPLFTFLYYLLPFTLVDLGLLALILYFAFRKELLRAQPPEPLPGAARDATLSKLSWSALALAVAGMAYSDVSRMTGVGPSPDIAEAALIGSLFLLLASRRRAELLRKTNWGVLAMFVGLFVFTEGVYRGGLLDVFSSYAAGATGSNVLLLMVTSSLLLSQLVSNVPTVILMMPFFAPILPSPVAGYWAAFAAASTLAGSLTVMGAASNLIVAEQSRKMGEGFSYGGFMKYGLPVTAVGVAVLLLALKLYGV
ncbi:MAG: anion transporter [Nitrososphaerota archaeon]|nr:anion transporter [Nitrososphaerota archaeon]MDG6940038.1 anion transporter [Nitrososphaerota archaeon]